MHRFACSETSRNSRSPALCNGKHRVNISLTRDKRFRKRKSFRHWTRHTNGPFLRQAEFFNRPLFRLYFYKRIGNCIFAVFCRKNNRSRASARSTIFNSRRFAASRIDLSAADLFTLGHGHRNRIFFLCIRFFNITARLNIRC